VKGRRDHHGAFWESAAYKPAAQNSLPHDFAGWVEVRAGTEPGGEVLLRHEWPAECAQTPPGKLLRLLRALPEAVEEEAAAVPVGDA